MTVFKPYFLYRGFQQNKKSCWRWRAHV